MRRTAAMTIVPRVFFLWGLVLTCASPQLVGQTAPKTEWARSLTDIDASIASQVEETRDGGVIMVGAARLADEDAPTDVYLVKTDEDGNRLWEKTFGGDDFDEGRAVKETEDGGFIVAGSTRSSGSGEWDVYLVKVSEEGGILWEKTFGGAADDTGYSVQETSDGGYVVVGSTESFGEGRSDVYLMKTDADGALLWEKTFQGVDDDWGSSVQEVRDGGFVVTGGTCSRAGGSVYLLRTDARGDLLWERAFGEGDVTMRCAWGRSVQAEDGHYVVTARVAYGRCDRFRSGEHDLFHDLYSDHGPFLATADYLVTVDEEGDLLEEHDFDGVSRSVTCRTRDGGYVVAGVDWGRRPGEQNVLIRTDAEGNRLWERTSKELEYLSFSAIRETSDGGFIAAGWNTCELAPDGSETAYLFRADQTGNLMWERTFGGVGSFVQETSDGGYIVIGKAEVHGQVMYLVKTDDRGKIDWERNFLGTVGSAIQESADGGYLAVGTAFPGTQTAYVLKIDEEGQPLWERHLGYGHGEHIQEAADGTFVITGQKTRDAYLAKIDTDGVVLWERTFGGEFSDMARSVQETTDGGYILAGASWLSNRGRDVLLVRTDTNGVALWERTLGGEQEDEEGFSVEQTPDGGFIVAGSIRPAIGENDDFYLVRTDGDGNVLWEKTYGTEREEIALTIQKTAGGGYVVGGTSRDHGGRDLHIMKIDEEGNSVWTRVFEQKWRWLWESGTPGVSVSQTLEGGFIAVGGSLLVKLGPEGPPVPFRRGDCTGDGEIDLSDAVCILHWLFAGEGAPGCVAATNTNADDAADISDATYLLNHLFAGGPAPAPPFPDCGPGGLPADAALGCETPPRGCEVEPQE